MEEYRYTVAQNDETPIPRAPESGLDFEVFREVVIFAVLLLLLVPLFWYAFNSDQSSEDDEAAVMVKEVVTTQPVQALPGKLLSTEVTQIAPVDLQQSSAPHAKQYQLAERQLQAGQLTLPAQDNALLSYQSVLEQQPDSPEAKQGIENVAQQYLELIEQLLAENRLGLLQANLNTVDSLAQLYREPAFEEEVARVQQQLEQRLTQQQSNTPTTSELTAIGELHVFQDELAGGGKGPAMVLIPAGRFTMGSPLNEVGRDFDEGPQREVAVSAFAVAQTEVTFADYVRFAQATDRPLPDDLGWGRGDRPVINVSWRDAVAYARWLTEETGHSYRLPTEAEWEYMARAGTATPFISGECLSAELANFDDNATADFSHCPGTGTFAAMTLPVGSLEPNAWGIHNVHGNVREWVQDCWVEGYPAEPVNGGAFTLTNDGTCGLDGKRILRGGTWSTTMRTSRVANRFAMDEYFTSEQVGFRVARDLK